MEENRHRHRSAENTRALLYQHNGQLFNDRGHPANLTSREFSRSMRRAQNEILSIVGVCVRDIPKPHDTQVNTTFEPDMLLIQRTALESMYGLIIRLAGAVLHCSITWWIDSLRQRLLVRLAQLDHMKVNERKGFRNPSTSRACRNHSNTNSIYDLLYFSSWYTFAIHSDIAQ